VPMRQVCVGISGGTLTIVYTVNSGWTISTVHALVSTTLPTQDIPGQFAYSSDNGTPRLALFLETKQQLHAPYLYRTHGEVVARRSTLLHMPM
jgi:hypothetical protein